MRVKPTQLALNCILLYLLQLVLLHQLSSLEAQTNHSAQNCPESWCAPGQGTGVTRLHPHSEERHFRNGRKGGSGRADTGVLHLPAWYLLVPLISARLSPSCCLRTSSGFLHSVKQTLLPPARDEPHAVEPFDPCMN